MGQRAKTKGELTIGAAIAAQKKRADKSVEIGLHKATPPDPPMAPRAIRRPWPGKKLATLENVLDADIHL